MTDTHYACNEVLARDGGKASCCYCTGHKCEKASELRSAIGTELLKHETTVLGTSPQCRKELDYTISMHIDNILELFEQEYLCRIEAAKPAKYTLQTGYLWDSHDATDGFHQGIRNYEHNLKQLSKGESR